MPILYPRRPGPESQGSNVMKKLINSPETVVTEALEGIAAAHPSLSVDIENKVITRAGGPTPGKVSLVSGGGSGHEPLHGGFVGYGMLDAACPGEVFTSPVPDQILAATKVVDGGAGVLHIVKNYTGDVLNFQMAAELAADDGVRVESVLVNDDVAVENSPWTAGRRGTGATVFVEKIVGAAAERGADLATTAALAREVNDRSRSFGVALTPCTVPAAGKPGFELGEDEIELGVGIHGEPGRRRGQLVPAKEIAGIALDAIDADHGINLSRGIQAAVGMLDEAAPTTPGAVLATVGRALISKTGGASGPLYGTGFRAAAKTLGDDPDVSPVQFGAALEAALTGI